VFSTVVSLVFLPTIYNGMDWLRRQPARAWHAIGRLPAGLRRLRPRLPRWRRPRRRRGRHTLSPEPRRTRHA
jgi:hypothetical protein